MSSSLFKKKKDLNLGLQAGLTTHEQSDDGRTPGQTTKSYPRKGFSQASDRDEYLRMKMDFVEGYGGTGASPFGTIYASDKDFEQILKKREAEEKANFDSWVGSNFHTNSVTDRAFLQKVYPQYYKARVEELENKAKLAVQIAKIDLFGPQNEDDLEVLYLIQSGQVELPTGWNIIGYNEAFNSAAEQKKFVKQLWAPQRYFSTAEKTKNAEKPATVNPFRTEDAGQRGYQANPLFAMNDVIPDKTRYTNWGKKTLFAPPADAAEN